MVISLWQMVDVNEFDLFFYYFRAAYTALKYFMVLNFK